MSDEARDRLRWLKAWQRLRSEGYSAQKAADILRLPRSTLYRWQEKLEKRGLIGLEDGDRRPKRVRKPQWSPELAEAVRRLREEHPGMGKEKLWVLLQREGTQTSISTIGRILKRLKARGVLLEPPRNGITKRKRRLVRPYATRKPKEYRAQKPGDLVQPVLVDCPGVDTLDVRPLSNVHFKQFTARDMKSRWDVVEAYRSATAGNARKFLDTLIERAPFPVRGIQVDGGSEFMAQFEQACAEKKIRLFVLPPRSPKLNGHVERAQRTHTEEFYDLYMGELDLKSINEALREWELFYNTVRPHHSLDLKTPEEYLSEYHSDLAPVQQPSHMY
jgi:transposase InsO family protein